MTDELRILKLSKQMLTMMRACESCDSAGLSPHIYDSRTAEALWRRGLVAFKFGHALLTPKARGILDEIEKTETSND